MADLILTDVVMLCTPEGKWVANGYWQEPAAPGGPMQGHIHASIAEGSDSTLSGSIDRVVHAASRLGIEVKSNDTRPKLSYLHDDEDFPPPNGWQFILRHEADRRGWIFAL